jgi:lysophospholipase L1-like esterase
VTRLAALLLGASLLFSPHHPSGPPSPQPIGGQVSIVPLGDSITWGSGSSDGNGYRKPLADLLSGAGVNWLLAGAQTHGSMPDNNNEGWPGATISALDARVGPSMVAPPLYHPPAYVLLYAGRNDAASGRTAVQMTTDMTALVDQMLAAAPYVRILLAQITATGLPAEQATDVAFDASLPALAGPRVRIVDQTGLAIGGDGIHPDDAGYADEGQRWFAAIQAWRGA